MRTQDGMATKKKKKKRIEWWSVFDSEQIDVRRVRRPRKGESIGWKQFWETGGWLWGSQGGLCMTGVYGAVLWKDVCAWGVFAKE